MKGGELALIVLFACFGNGTIFVARTYTAGFYIDFLAENNLDKTFGTCKQGKGWVAENSLDKTFDTCKQGEGWVAENSLDKTFGTCKQRDGWYKFISDTPNLLSVI